MFYVRNVKGISNHVLERLQLLNMDDNVSRPGRVVQKPKRKINKCTHRLVKRPPAKREQGQNVIYVTSSNCSIKALEERCAKLVYKEVDEIIIYALGAAIKQGILLALQVSERHCIFQVSVNTFTTELTDDLEPVTDDVDYETQSRQNSALRIVLTRNI